MIATRLRLTLGTAVLALGLVGLGVAAGQRPTAGRAAVDNPAPALAPLAGQTGQPPPKKKAEPAEKVPPKGIEDDDVPYPVSPAQAVVRLEDGKLIIRTRSRTAAVPAVPRATGGEGGPGGLAAPPATTAVAAQKVDPADVAVYDVKGNRVPPKAWKEKLQADQHVLIAYDGRPPHPRELTLFRDDVLLVVLPGPAPGTGGLYAPRTAYRLRQGPNGESYYEPVTVYGPSTVADPALPALPTAPPAAGVPTAPPATGLPPAGRPAPLAPPQLPPDGD